MHWNVASDALLDLKGLYVFCTAGVATALREKKILIPIPAVIIVNFLSQHRSAET